MWIEPAIGSRSHGVRRWVRRVLLAKLAKAAIVMLLAFVGVIALGRLYYAFEPEPSAICVTSDCPLPGGLLDDPPPSPWDIWDAIF